VGIQKDHVKNSVECSVIASVLDSGRVAAMAGHAAAVIAGVGAVLSSGDLSRVAFAASLFAWPVGCYFALRVTLDASLFRCLEADPVERPDLMDQLLHSWGLLPQVKQRSLADRIAGALRLWRRQQIVLAVQLAALAVGILIRVGGR
jgi:hypothetical protein